MLAPHAVDIAVIISSLITSYCFTFAEPFDDTFLFVKSREWIHARSLNTYFAFWKIVVKTSCSGFQITIFVCSYSLAKFKIEHAFYVWVTLPTRYYIIHISASFELWHASQTVCMCARLNSIQYLTTIIRKRKHMLFLSNFSINLQAPYHECCSLIRYATHYLFCCW